MWCYQKPGFEALLLAELQRQQQCSQFCDTLLKAEGVSVPAHSCVLSAISPHVSSALSSTPAPPAGQSRLLDFRALGACTLLHMVRLLYSGEMAGEGEKEKQEAISAAAKLGIHGLVEVKKSDDKNKRNEEGGGQSAEVGVQTEPLMLEQDEGRRGAWRREVRDGTTYLWKDTASSVEKGTGTQTEDLQVDTAPPTHSVASFETIDMTALQGVVQTDTHLPPPQIPYVPLSLIYPPQQNQAPQPSSAPAASMQEATAAGHTSVGILAPPCTPRPPTEMPSTSQTAMCATDPHSWWAGPQGAAADFVESAEWEGEQLEQFQDNIPGFINYFLNPEKEEQPSRGRAAKQRRGVAGAGAARRGGTGERRARRPPARTGGRGRGRGGLTQTVDVQDVGVSKLQKLFLQRSGMRSSTPGQGGGAAGRKLFLKTREFLKPTRRRRKGDMPWEFGQIGDIKGGGAQRGGRSTAQQFKQEGLPVGRAQSVRTKAPVALPSTPMHYYNLRTLSTPSHSFNPTPSPIMLSAASLLHTTGLPPPPPPPHEEQPEHIERLLEEVMMGLDILPNNKVTPHSQLPLPAASSSSSSCNFASSSGNHLAQSKQQGCGSGLLHAGPTQVVCVARGGSGYSSSEVPALQQQGEGPIPDMLDHFLQTFERHFGNNDRDEQGTDAESNTVLNKDSGTKRRTTTAKDRLQDTHTPGPAKTPHRAQPKHSKTDKALACLNHSPSKNTKGKQNKKSYRRNKRGYLFSLEKKSVKKRDTKAKIRYDGEDKQLQKIPVVKLERGGPLPVNVSCQSLEVRDPAPVKAKRERHTSSQKSEMWPTKTYPIRSRFRDAYILDTVPFLEGNRSPTACKPVARRSRPRKNEQLGRLSNGESSTPPQLQPEEPCGVNGQGEETQERREEELTVQPKEEAEGATRRGEKRGGETSDDATVAKRFCSEQISQSTSEPDTSSESAAFVSEPAATEADEVIDVETVSLTDVVEEPEEKNAVWRETEKCPVDKESEGSDDEIIDVDGFDADEPCDQDKHAASPPSHPEKERSVRSTGSWEDEVIDVTGGSSPAPDPEVITWTETSEGEEEDGEEDVDVVGEKTGYISSILFAAMIKGELLEKKLKTEVI